MVGNLDPIVAILKSHLEQEAQAGFPRLTRIPSAYVIRFLDYFEALTPVDRASCLAALAEIDALKFFPPPFVRERAETLVNTNPALRSCREAMQSPRFTMGLRYGGLRMLKAMLADP